MTSFCPTQRGSSEPPGDPEQTLRCSPPEQPRMAANFVLVRATKEGGQPGISDDRIDDRCDWEVRGMRWGGPNTSTSNRKRGGQIRSDTPV